MIEDAGKVANIVKVTFDGDDLEAVRDGAQAWVVLRRVCEVLGIRAHGQAAKLKSLSWAVTQMICATGPDGKRYESFCLDIDSLAGWLFTINPGKVKPELREKLIRYQRECAKVLRDHFFGRASAAPTMPSMEDIMAMVRSAVSAALPAFFSPVSGDGVIGHEEARKIRAELMAIALLDADGNAMAARGRRTKHDNELRSSLQFFGSCRSWDMLPRDKLGSVTVLLQEIRKRVRDEAGRRNQARQGTLFTIQ